MKCEKGKKTKKKKKNQDLDSTCTDGILKVKSFSQQ